MMLMENFQLALEGLRSNKMRALLTMLGIIIGIGSVIAIMTVGDSLTSSVSGSLQSMGATNVIIQLQGKDRGFGPNTAMPTVTTADLITDEMLENYIRMNGNNIQAISLQRQGGSGKAQDSRKYANVTLLGVNDGYAETNNLELLSGRFLREKDIKSSRYTAVISDKFVKNMFAKNEKPLGKKVKVTFGDSLQEFTIVGIYKYEDSTMMAFGVGGASSDKDLRTNMFIPITTCGIISSSNDGYQGLTVMAKQGVDTDKFADRTKDFFEVYYANNPNFRIAAVSMNTIMNSATSIMGTLSVAVAIIAAISLIVGGVGVMNIMLVSVTERTREIGTRKALGARSSSIRMQFIVEAIIICSIGGILGILLGILLGYVGSSVMGFPGWPSTFIMIAAFLFSAMTGVFFGYYPANKAAKLDPIEALRYE